jgi:hypothetical protein
MGLTIPLAEACHAGGYSSVPSPCSMDGRYDLPVMT